MQPRQNQDDYNYDFSGTKIKSPADKMRAHSVINAANTQNGLSMINFNLSFFMKTSRTHDVAHILSLWAIAPVKKSADKFFNHPEAGTHALKARVDALIQHLSCRHDLHEDFIESCKDKMVEAIDNEIDSLFACNSDDTSTKKTA